jgi:hypothetical protein
MKKLTKIYKKKLYKKALSNITDGSSLGICSAMYWGSDHKIDIYTINHKLNFNETVNQLPELELFNHKFKNDDGYMDCDKLTREIILDFCYNMC